MGSRNRAGVKRRLAEIAEFVLEHQVTVGYGWPGDSIEDSRMYFAGVEGASEPDAFAAGQTPTSDRFTIPVFVAVTPFFDPADAEEAVEAVVRTYEDALRGCSRLKDKNGVIPDGDTDAYAGVRSAVIASADGPMVALSQPTQDSPIAGLYRLDIECVSDY